MSIRENIEHLRAHLPENVTLVAVSKTHTPEAIMEAYSAGQRIFGENRPQEMVAKREVLPADIRWHLVGQLQTNKVKYIAPFVELIHSVDSDKLLSVIDKEAIKNNRTIDVLLEVHIAREQTKSGWDADDLRAYLAGGTWRQYGNVRIRGLMSIATNTADTQVIREEFSALKALFEELRENYFSPQSGLFGSGDPEAQIHGLENGSSKIVGGDLRTQPYGFENENSKIVGKDSGIQTTGKRQPCDHPARQQTDRQQYYDVSARQFDILSAGMTSDYLPAIECGSNMVRIGSLIFGER